MDKSTPTVSDLIDACYSLLIPFFQKDNFHTFFQKDNLLDLI